MAQDLFGVQNRLQKICAAVGLEIALGQVNARGSLTTMDLTLWLGAGRLDNLVYRIA